MGFVLEDKGIQIVMRYMIIFPEETKGQGPE